MLDIEKAAAETSPSSDSQLWADFLSRLESFIDFRCTDRRKFYLRLKGFAEERTHPAYVGTQRRVVRFGDDATDLTKDIGQTGQFRKMRAPRVQDAGLNVRFTQMVEHEAHARRLAESVRKGCLIELFVTGPRHLDGALLRSPWSGASVPDLRNAHGSEVHGHSGIHLSSWFLALHSTEYRLFNSGSS